ncbi:MAG: DUF523 domain-containing protein [Halobacteriovoraceae bacterium]|nr:DUF523 domain-containing protein [Halobacteriovoraceae bacterium]
MIVISACLAGIRCRYDGDSIPQPDLIELCQKGEAIAVCPEVAGGLSTPREPSEKRGNQFITLSGKDVTQNYIQGAKNSWEEIKDLPIEKAILKSKSPMCGVCQVYDGSFKGQLIEGQGEFAALLKEKGIPLEERD